MAISMTLSPQRDENFVPMQDSTSARSASLSSSEMGRAIASQALMAASRAAL